MSPDAVSRFSISSWMNLCMNGLLWASDGAIGSCQANVLMCEKS